MGTLSSAVALVSGGSSDNILNSEEGQGSQRAVMPVMMMMMMIFLKDCLCSVVIRVPDCRSRGPEYDSRFYHVFCVAVGLERGPISLMRIGTGSIQPREEE
jgi:hypothetical protein